MLEALPAVTEPPVSLKLGRSFRNLAASNWHHKKVTCEDFGMELAQGI